MLIRRALSFVFALCCALLLWPAFAANPTCGVLLLLVAAVAFADPTTGVMIVLALSPVATMAVSTFWGTPGDWAEMVAVAAGLGWLLRQTIRDDCCCSGDAIRSRCNSISADGSRTGSWFRIMSGGRTACWYPRGPTSDATSRWA